MGHGFEPDLLLPSELGHLQNRRTGQQIYLGDKD